MTSNCTNPLTLACWNIYRGVGTDNVKSMQRIGDWIAHMNSDVAALREVPTPEEDQIALQSRVEELTAAKWHSHFMTGGVGAKEHACVQRRYL